MKKSKNALYLLLAFIPCLSFINLYADVIPLERPTNFHIPDNMPMPSVDDLFGGMTEEQIVQQIQEAQKLFESLSPEEMEEFAKIVDETWAKMPPSDRDAIQDIANMVKPYFPEQEEAAPAKQAEPVEESVKPKKVVVENNSVQNLIDNISATVDEILQKISSSKDLVEEFTIKWPSKFTFDNLKRQILALKEDRLANKLVLKANAEDKELIEKLEKLYKDLFSKNELFYVEDLFGLPSSSKSQDAKQLKQTKEILALFDEAIDELMPKIEIFLKKHAPEALEMAKEAEERAKRAQTHAKDASVKRGSAAATPSPEPTRKTTSSQQPTTSSSAPSYYDSYAPYGGNYGYNSMYDTYPTANYPSSDNKPSEKKDEPKKEDVKKTTEKKDDSKSKKEFTPYDDALDALEGYFDKIDSKTHQNFLNFLQKDLSDYPKATDRVGEVANKETQRDWLNGTGNFKDKGFKDYVRTMNDQFGVFGKVLKEVRRTCEAVERNVRLVNDNELKKLSENKSLKEIQNRLKAYNTNLDKAIEAYTNQYTANIDNRTTFLTDEPLQEYIFSHKNFEKDVRTFKEKFDDADDALQDVFKRIKGVQRRNKTAAEKEAQKANALGF